MARLGRRASLDFIRDTDCDHLPILDEPLKPPLSPRGAAAARRPSLPSLLSMSPFGIMQRFLHHRTRAVIHEVAFRLAALCARRMFRA